MTLPIALLISNYLSVSIAPEIQETVEDITYMHELSCKCSRHRKNSFLIPTTPTCSVSSEDETEDKPILEKIESSVDKPILEKIKSSEPLSSFSYFDEKNDRKKIVGLERSELKSKQDLWKSLEVALKALDRLDYESKKMEQSKKELNDQLDYESKKIEHGKKEWNDQLDYESKKIEHDKKEWNYTQPIIYGNRDILDLGSNITAAWSLQHPSQIASFNNSSVDRLGSSEPLSSSIFFDPDVKCSFRTCNFIAN